VSDTTHARETAGGTRIGARAARRLAWSLWAASVALVALALLLESLTFHALLAMSLVDDFHVLAVPISLLSLVYPTMGALIASRLPRNPIGWIFCVVGLLYGMRRSVEAYADYSVYGNFALPWGHSWLYYLDHFAASLDFEGRALAGVSLMLLFPTGRLPSRRWRIVAWVALCGAALTMLSDALGPEGNPRFGIVGAIGGVITTYELFAALYCLGMTLLLAGTIAALLSLAVRLSRSRGDERQQLIWFLYAAVPAAMGLSVAIVENVVARFTTDLLFSTVHLLPRWFLNFADVDYLSIVALLALPVCTYIAILRYRLYDIDRLVNRTLVYGALTACVVGIYVLAVGGLGVLFQARGNLAVSLLATGLVTVLFQPLRSRLQRGVNRMMYGERDDPYEVTSRLGRRLEAALVPEAVLPTIAETIAQALKLPYAAILLKEADSFRTAAAYGSPTGEPEALPLVYQREEIGRLIIAPRAPGEEFSAADRRLLQDLARQAEVAVHAVRLTGDLQRSREQLVAGREEERRRLRRDLHDGLGPTLASFALKLDAARKLLRRKPEDAEEMLSRLKDQTQDTVGDVRRLVYGLRPPALDDLGLLAAVRQQAEGHGFVVASLSANADSVATGEDGSVSFSLETPEGLPSLPAAVEVAAYRIVQEALTNVARHAHAKTCRVRFSVDGRASVLELEVRDDGVGMPEGRRAGVGLSSMRERAEELGGTRIVEPGPEGGTRVLVRLPLPLTEERPEGEGTSWSAPSASS